MKVSFITHRGAVRPQNQDALQIAERFFTGDMDAPGFREVKDLKTPLLLSVVDGMGGHRGGEEAAAILARALAAASGSFAPDPDAEADERLLRGILKAAAEEMDARAHEAPELSGMGATVAGVILRERSALAFNCGDCRTYRFSGGEPEKLTHDHSVVQTLRDRNEISEEEMRLHPRKNIVTAAVMTGASEDLALFVRPVSRTDGDAFFLCSDGVWEALPLRELEFHLGDPAPDAPQRLFNALLRSECRDNVSFVWTKTSQIDHAEI